MTGAITVAQQAQGWHYISSIFNYVLYGWRWLWIYAWYLVVRMANLASDRWVEQSKYDKRYYRK